MRRAVAIAIQCTEGLNGFLVFLVGLQLDGLLVFPFENGRFARFNLRRAVAIAIQCAEGLDGFLVLLAVHQGSGGGVGLGVLSFLAFRGSVRIGAQLGEERNGRVEVVGLPFGGSFGVFRFISGGVIGAVLVGSQFLERVVGGLCLLCATGFQPQRKLIGAFQRPLVRVLIARNIFVYILSGIRIFAIRHQHTHVLIKGFLKACVRFFIVCFRQKQVICCGGLFIVLLFVQLRREVHDVLVHARCGGGVRFTNHLAQRAPAFLLLKLALGFREVAVEDFVRQRRISGLCILEKENAVVDLAGFLVLLVRLIAERGEVLDIHARFLEVAQRGQALDGGFVVTAIARLQTARVHDVFAAVLVIVQRFKGRNGLVIFPGLYVRDGLIVGILHPRALGLGGERGVGRDVNGRPFEAVQRLERGDCGLIVAAVACLNGTGVGDVFRAILIALQRFKVLDGLRIVPVPHGLHGLLIFALFADGARAKPQR